MDSATATQDILMHLKKIVDMEISLKKLVGWRNETCVNHLYAHFNEDYVLVSEYVIRWLSLKYELSAVTAMLNNEVVRRNPAFQEWVVEFAFLVKLRSKIEIEVSSHSTGNSEKWEVNGVIEEFEPTALSVAPSNPWLIPKRWNQGGYDFVQFVPKEILRFVQVTRGKTHGFKLRYMIEMAKALRELNLGETKFLDIVLLCPLGGESVVGTITSDKDLQSFTDKRTQKKWTKDCIRVMNFQCVDTTTDFST